MNNEVFEEVQGAEGGAKAKLEKQARQLAYDTKYKVKQALAAKSGGKADPATVSKMYMAQLSKSPAPPAVKALAKKKLLGEEYVDVREFAVESVTSALLKVFVEKNEEVTEEIFEEEKSGEQKFHVKVTDKKTGNTYRRYATRAKIAELRSNPNISSVEMTHHGEQSAKERTKGADTAAVKSGKGLDPVGKEDKDIDNDGDHDKTDKYLLNRRKVRGKAIATRKEEVEIQEVTKMGVHSPHEVPSKNLKGLVKKAVKRIDADNDGDVDKDDPKETGMGEFVPSPDGKKKIRTSVRTESFSNWRQDLSEVMTDDEAEKEIKEKKVENKIKINPKLGEALEEIGATLIEMIEVDEFDYIVESVYDELLEEGYEEDDVEEAIEYALTEAKVTFGHDTPTKKDDVMKKAKGRLRFLGRKVGEKIGAAKKSAKYASARAQVAAYNKGREVAQTAGDKTRKARKAVADAPEKAKKGLKGAIKKAAQKVADRMSEETEIEEGIGMTMAKAVGNPPALSKRMKLKQALLNREIKKNAAENKKKSYSGKAANEEVEQVDEKLNMKKEKMGDVIKDFYKSDAPQFKGKSKEKRRQMAIAAKLTAERGGRKLGEGTTEMPMSPQEISLQRKKTAIDMMIAKKRQQALQKQKEE